MGRGGLWELGHLEVGVGLVLRDRKGTRGGWELGHGGMGVRDQMGTRGVQGLHGPHCCLLLPETAHAPS